MLCDAYAADVAAQLRDGSCSWELLQRSGFSLFELYRRFERQKRDRFVRRHELEDVVDNTSFSDNFDAMHQNCAMYLLMSDGSFPNADSTPFQEYVLRNRSLLIKEKTGILWTEEDGQPKFAHFSFVQYFAAAWLCSNFSSCETAKTAVRELFLKNEGLLRNFLEHMLAADLPLHRAILCEDMGAVVKMLEGGAEVLRADRGGRLPLHLAATRGMAQAAAVFIREGCDPARRDALLGFTALQYADMAAVAEIGWLRRRDHLAVAEELLRAGADAAHLASTLAAAVSDASVTVDAAARGLVLVTLLVLDGIAGAKKLLTCDETNDSDSVARSNHEPLKEKEYSQEDREIAGLHAAAALGQYEVVQIFLKRGCDPNAPINLKRRPLRAAAQFYMFEEKEERFISNRRRAKVISILLQHGADPNLPEDGDILPLHFAAQSGNEGAASLLLAQTKDVNAADVEGQTFLHYACIMYFTTDKEEREIQKKSKAYIVRLLLECGADCKRADTKGRLPLHIASHYGNEQIIELLISAGADVNARDVKGSSALHLAARHGNRKAVRFLLESGALESRNNAGKTAMHKVAKGGYADVTEMLLDHGFDVTAVDNHGREPLHYAARGYGRSDYEKFKVSRANTVSLMIQHGGSNRRDLKGCTPLDLAVKSNNKLVEERLSEAVNNLQTAGDAEAVRCNGRREARGVFHKSGEQR